MTLARRRTSAAAKVGEGTICLVSSSCGIYGELNETLKNHLTWLLILGVIFFKKRSLSSHLFPVQLTPRGRSSLRKHGLKFGLGLMRPTIVCFNNLDGFSYRLLQGSFIFSSSCFYYILSASRRQCNTT